MERKGQFPMSTALGMTNAMTKANGNILASSVSFDQPTRWYPWISHEAAAFFRQIVIAPARAFSAVHSRQIPYVQVMSNDEAEDVQRFHRWSRSYETSLGQAFLFDPVHRRVIGLIASAFDGSSPACVLDVGCGTGRLLRKAARRWPAARLIGVDPAEGMIEIARRLTPSAGFLGGSGEAIPLPDAVVDIAFSTISFHHWENQAAGVREVARVLRPGGRFCLADGALPSPAAGLIRHSRIHTRGEIEALFRQAGLAVRMQKKILAGAVLVTVGVKA